MPDQEQIIDRFIVVRRCCRDGPVYTLVRVGRCGYCGQMPQRRPAMPKIPGPECEGSGLYTVRDGAGCWARTVEMTPVPGFSSDDAVAADLSALPRIPQT